MNTRAKGKEAEDAAAAFLREKGYDILARNFYGERKEIDIIARKRGLVIFVEVKSSNTKIPPETMVNEIKVASLAQAAEAFIAESQIKDVDYRFDILAMRKKGAYWQINHIEDAFSNYGTQ